MSEEQAKAFIVKVQVDSTLLEQLKAECADISEIANAVGFSIMTEQLNSYCQNLSDEELQNIIGGSTNSVW